jgi:hypothetical protein
MNFLDKGGPASQIVSAIGNALEYVLKQNQANYDAGIEQWRRDEQAAKDQVMAEAAANGGRISPLTYNRYRGNPSDVLGGLATADQYAGDPSINNVLGGLADAMPAGANTSAPVRRRRAAPKPEASRPIRYLEMGDATPEEAQALRLKLGQDRTITEATGTSPEFEARYAAALRALGLQ